jgi:hypothetical protein
MNHEAVQVNYADGRALICLVGKVTHDSDWEHIRTLSSVDAEVGNLEDALRRYCSKLKLERI